MVLLCNHTLTHHLKNITLMRVSTPDKRMLIEKVGGLSLACPLDDCKSLGCPFNRVRKMDCWERFEWVKTLTEKEANMLLSFHSECLEEKIQNLPWLHRDEPLWQSKI